MKWLCDETCPALSASGSHNYKDYDHLSLDALLRIRDLDSLVAPSGNRWRGETLKRLGRHD
jgi:hypothetical protein